MARELSGTLSRNEKREEGTNQPEYRGKALINGIEFRISAWVKEYEGRKFFSLAFSPPKEEPKTQASPELKAKYVVGTAGGAGGGGAQRGGYSPRTLDDDSIPFMPCR